MAWIYSIIFASFITASRGFPTTFPGNFDEDDPITLYDSAMSECFRATLDMNIVLYDQEDDMMAITKTAVSLKQRVSHQIHVNTSSPAGLCPGERGRLGWSQQEVTGPALYFAWNASRPYYHTYHVLLLWDNLEDAYYLDTVEVQLGIPSLFDPVKMKYLMANITDLRLFRVSYGENVKIKTERREIQFNTGGSACYVFEHGSLELIDSVYPLPVITVVCISAVALLMMAAGGYFWVYGTRDKQKKKQQQQQFNDPLPPIYKY